MSSLFDVAKIISLTTALNIGASSALLAQETTEAAETANVIVETFDGEDPSLMLGAQIDFRTDKSPWLVYVSDGKLILENRKNPQSIHYNDVKWVKFPEADAITTTENAVISVVVDGENEGRGGAGFLVGSGIAGVYLMFSVDEQGRYHLFHKDGRKVRPVHSAKHDAIEVGEPNTLTFEVRGANIAFFVNGTEVIKLPNPTKLAHARQTDGRTGIGLAAFGIGKFSFDSVEISQTE